MEMLTKDTIIEAVSTVKNGTYVRIGYRTELPVKAELKKKGVRAYKLTETTVRLGVNYGRIASVIARKAEENLEEVVKRANNYEWVIKDKVRYNTKTQKDYLYVANTNGRGHNTKSVFVLVPGGNDISITCHGDIFENEFKDVLIPSYWTQRSSGGHSEVRNIAFDNIYKIGKYSTGTNLAEV